MVILLYNILFINFWLMLAMDSADGKADVWQIYPEEISSVWNHTISLGQIYSKYAIYIFQKGILDFD